MELYYKSSEGVILNLIGDNYKMLSETDLFNTEWQYETVGTNYPYITAFKNQMVSKSCTLIVNGLTNNDLKDNLEHLIEVVDRDVRIGQMGRIYYGNYYRECYCTATEKGKIEGQTKTSIGLTFVAEDGDWKSTQDQSYSGVSGGEYLNPYSVPSVSSGEYSYGSSDGVQGTVEINPQFTQYIDIGSADTFTLKSFDDDIQYQLPNGSWVTVTEFPYDIDVSSVPLYVNASGRKTVARIGLHSSSSGTLEYETVASENTTTIDWEHSSTDTEPIFTIDLGAVLPIKEIDGLDVGLGRELQADETVSLQISANGVDWTTVDDETIPTSIGSTVTLNHTWTSDFPSVRYIRIHSSLIGSSTTFASYYVMTKHFVIKAHFEGENQNMALSSIFSSDNVTVNNWGLDSNLDFTLQGSGSHWFTFTLSNPTTIVEIGSITLQSSTSTPVYADYIDTDGETHRIGTAVATSQGATLNFTGIELEDVVAISFDSIGSVNYTSSNFEILEEQTQAPHRYILNENYVPSDAIIKIYGATLSPSIMIGDNQYGAENITLDDGEYLEINTKDETIKHYVDSEGWVNVFNHRLDETFEKIEVGTSEITWDGNLKLDIELLNSRSDPKWN